MVPWLVSPGRQQVRTGAPALGISWVRRRIHGISPACCIMVFGRGDPRGHGNPARSSRWVLPVAGFIGSLLPAPAPRSRRNSRAPDRRARTPAQADTLGSGHPRGRRGLVRAARLGLTPSEQGVDARRFDGDYHGLRRGRGARYRAAADGRRDHFRERRPPAEPPDYAGRRLPDDLFAPDRGVRLPLPDRRVLVRGHAILRAWQAGRGDLFRCALFQRGHDREVGYGDICP